MNEKKLQAIFDNAKVEYLSRTMQEVHSYMKELDEPILPKYIWGAKKYKSIIDREDMTIENALCSIVSAFNYNSLRKNEMYRLLAMYYNHLAEDLES